MRAFIVSRLKERSTWYALVLIALAFGARFTPEQQAALLALGAALAGTPDR